MKIFKDNILTESMFELLIKINPSIAEQMIRNKIVAQSTEDYDRIGVDDDGDEVYVWLTENCVGLIYIINKSTLYRDNYAYHFEKEEDMVAFKLRWQ